MDGSLALQQDPVDVVIQRAMRPGAAIAIAAHPRNMMLRAELNMVVHNRLTEPNQAWFQVESYFMRGLPSTLPLPEGSFVIRRAC